ncbi:MAG: division plane positioning ATPase MipZ [Bdellovibrionales bacterium]
MTDLSATQAPIQDSKQEVSPQPKDPIVGEGAHVIVFGNEKGGSGKSTTAMHVAISLLRLGYKVGTIDLDARQGTLSRYMRNRFSFIKNHKKYIPSPEHLAIDKSQAPTVAEQEEQENAFFEMALGELQAKNHFVIVDTPGTDSFLSRLAHSHADTIITPMNDSFIDLDLLAEIDPDTFEIKGPSVYTQMVEEQMRQKKMRNGGSINWIVMRNRLSHINAKNKLQIAALLKQISKFAEFTVASGFGERVVFRELFLKGLTLLDLKDDPKNPLTMSQIGARQEVRQLIMTLSPETLKGRVQPLRRKTS